MINGTSSPNPSRAGAMQHMRRARRRNWLAYSVALASPWAVLVARILLEPAMRGNPGMVLFVFPSLISAYLGGLGAGLTATALSALITNYFLVAPVNSFSITSGMQNVQWIALIGIGTLTSILMSSLRRHSDGSSYALENSRFFLEKRVHVTFALAVISLCVIAFNSYSIILKSQQDSASVGHTHEVIASLRLILSTATDAETAERGFTITGKDEFLDPYRQSVQRIDSEILKLRVLTAENPSQQSRLDSLQTLVGRRMAILDEVLKTRRSEGFPAAQALIAYGGGKQLHDQLRNTISEMAAVEGALLTERELRARRSIGLAKSALAVGFGFALSMIMVAAFLIARDFTGVRRARASLLNANDELQHRVHERTAANEELQVSRERLSLALDVAKLGTWDLYFSENRMECSSRAMAALGQAPDAKLSFDQCLGLLHADDRGKIRRATEESWKTTRDFDLELRTTWSDNSLHWLAMRGRTYRDESGNPLRLSGVMQEITQQKKMAETQLRSQKMDSLGTLAGGIAHEFNNIILAIGGNAALASDDLPPDHPAQSSLSEIKKSGSRASDLVQHILSYSRPQDSKREMLPLEPLLQEAVKLVRSTIPATIEVRTEIAAGLPLASINPSQMLQILINLATNAAYAIGQRAGKINLRLKETRVDHEDSTARRIQPGRYLVLQVEDDGCGMDLPTQLRAFDPFFTTKPVGQGTGLGLSVADGIIRNHGGTITLHSEPGKGSVFQVYLPVPARAANPKAPFSPRAAQANNRHVLYVDDEEALVTLITRRLTRMGYKVTGLTDPEAAICQFSAAPESFDAVVTDLAMPRCSGLELSRQVLALRPDMPVVIISGYVQPQDEAMARTIGVRQVLLKPSTTEDLSNALDSLLRNWNPATV
jgi:signal transduction histidine kinase/CHASE3 domain sensor protein/ActR/RegA family two-component response regulator